MDTIKRRSKLSKKEDNRGAPAIAPAIPADRYSKVGLDELVAYSAFSLSSREESVTFENVVAECFKLFPKRFELRGYPEWPDASVVSKSVWRARTDKKYLSGSVKNGFHLTPTGLRVADEVHRVMNGGTSSSVLPSVRLTETRTRAGRILRSLEQSVAYRRYLRTGDSTDISAFDFADMLLCPPDAAADALMRNLEYFKSCADLYERKDILEFLNRLGKRFKEVLGRRQ